MPESSGLKGGLSFVLDGFPALVYRLRPFILAALAVFLVGAVMGAVWEPLGQLMIPSTYHTPKVGSAESPLVSAYIIGNNVRVALMAFAGGVTFGIATLLVIFNNGAMIGGVSVLIARLGESAGFWPSLAPHGVVELTAIIIAAGAGLRLGWSMVATGELRRGDSLKEGARDALGLALGTVPLFLAAGVVEGYVSFSRAPVSAKLTVAALAACALVAYLSRGRGAARPSSPPGGTTR